MTTKKIIDQLKKSNLYAECPCGAEFKLSRSILFDGTKSFPNEALDIQLQLQEEFEERKANLKKKKKLATERAEITTRAVNIGRSLEKVLPTMKDFKWTLSDSRFLGDPIDLIVFSGLSIRKVTSIDFIEVKSGRARLNPHQKLIKDAIEDEKVSYKVLK